MSEFTRFPHTPHLAWLGKGRPRNDKMMSQMAASAVLATAVVVEEKIDGANLGISRGPDQRLRIQNRGQYLDPPYTGQFARLGNWLAVHHDRLRDSLTESLIAFGEWCAARHSLDYDQLPDWWLMFDVYDRSASRFWSTKRRNQLAESMGVTSVPCLYRGTTSLTELNELTANQVSGFRSGPLEGLIVRQEDPLWLRYRAKLVRAEFNQNIIEHWRNRPVVWNRVRTSADQLDSPPS